ncbi:PEP-CTERM sorting domain-containing protein [uncultured Nitrosomonas sp.]|uniref:PEP-CTERM sorting domain-containing protein n=1 Tax=uncultured Nitrosomonas sp. TaxID=156424 RepID=UPI0026276CD8|nr:PEP-CTERM sorting domain-containing protein [uncultured Nitrosomonas sp.]
MQLFLNKKMGSNIRKAAVLTAAIVSMTVASASWADNITVNYNGLTGSSGKVNPHPNGAYFGGVSAGLMTFAVQSGPSMWGSNLQAFCVDINTWLVTGQNVTYDIVSANSTGGLSALALTQVSWLFDNHASALSGSNSDKTAFQLTLWEMLFEGQEKIPFNLETGNFQAQNFGTPITTANTWLANAPTIAGGVSNQWEFYVLNPKDPVNNQRLITWREKPKDPNEISEPATLLLLSAGLGMIFFSTRRSGAQFASLA